MSASSSSNASGSDFIHEFPVLIVERHLDTFGHVNNATYLQLFEEARWDLISRGGYGLDVIEATRQGPVILEVTVRFKRELKNRASVVIESQLVSYTEKVGRLSQRVRMADGQIACEALFSLALWDLDARKLILPTPAWLGAIQPVPSAPQPLLGIDETER